MNKGRYHRGENERRHPFSGEPDFENDVTGVLARVVEEGQPIDRIQLRETGQERDKIAAAVRAELRRLYGQHVIDLMDSDEVDDFLHYVAGFRALKILWEMGLYDRKEPSKADIDRVFKAETLRAIAHLDSFKVHAGADELLIYDGCSEVPVITRGFNYPAARVHCAILGVSMLTESEFSQIYSGFSTKTRTWLESGNESRLAREGAIHLGQPVFYDRKASASFPARGVRRAVRIKIVPSVEHICTLQSTVRKK